jgi:hypothetical protein
MNISPIAAFLWTWFVEALGADTVTTAIGLIRLALRCDG